MLLKPLIGIIYTKLFKAVFLEKNNKKPLEDTQIVYEKSLNSLIQFAYLEWLKPINIKDTYGSPSTSFTHFKWLVNLFYKPVKQACIDKFC